MNDKNESNVKKQSKLRQPLTISPKELALVLGVSLRQVWRLNEMGKLPKPIRLGTLVKWKISEISDWIDDDCPDLKTWEAKKKCSKISKSNCLLDQVAEILLNLQTGAYTPEQSEGASEILEAILRRHYEGGTTC